MVVAVGTTAAWPWPSPALGAYALARLLFPGRGLIARGLVLTYLVPPALLFIPLYVMMNNSGLRDSLGGLVLAHLTSRFRSQPGCSWATSKRCPSSWRRPRWWMAQAGGTLLGDRALPLAAPAVVVCAVFAFTLSWNEFLYATVFVNSIDVRTVTIGPHAVHRRGRLLLGAHDGRGLPGHAPEGWCST